jgi:hypothetical protein
MTDHHHSTAPRSEHVLLDLGDECGALVLYTDADLHGAEIEISPSRVDTARSHKQVHERPVGGRTIYAAVFDRLAPGEYTLWLDGDARSREIAVTGARVAELDWRKEMTR